MDTGGGYRNGYRRLIQERDTGDRYRRMIQEIDTYRK